MISMIPNPKKSVVVNYSLNKIRDAVKNIDKVMKSCKFKESNDMFNYYKFYKNEFISFGAIININLNEVEENKTEINIEISRKIGAFDSWVEVDYANRHIDETLQSISYIISNGVPIKPLHIEPKDMSISQAALLYGIWFVSSFVAVFFFSSLNQFSVIFLLCCVPLMTWAIIDKNNQLKNKESI